MVHEQEITQYAYEQLSRLPEIELVGPQPDAGRLGSVAFLYKGVHAHDVAQILDRSGVAVRSGHHCTMPLHTVLWLASDHPRQFCDLYHSRGNRCAGGGADQVKKVFRH